MLIFALSSRFSIDYLSKHDLSAFKKGFITYGLFTGPGEALFVFQMAIVVKMLTGFDYFWGPISRILAMLPDALSGDPVSQVHTVYYAFLIALIIRVVVIKENPATRNILLFCLLYRTVPSRAVECFRSLWFLDPLVPDKYMIRHAAEL
ncbi:hypothetical protein FOZ62_008670 [Perkinsus olseni]|uniref:Uncharacterized protein n=1 Tax=Perkinsus olseni TaxID=32597 RepID=A0A7J6S3G2_PEROL|nr:hypothetical protein FOZ62_008670 [Perkinsus olseni]